MAPVTGLDSLIFSDFSPGKGTALQACMQSSRAPLIPSHHHRPTIRQQSAARPVQRDDDVHLHFLRSHSCCFGAHSHHTPKSTRMFPDSLHKRQCLGAFAIESTQTKIETTATPDVSSFDARKMVRYQLHFPGPRCYAFLGAGTICSATCVCRTTRGTATSHWSWPRSVTLTGSFCSLQSR